MIRERSEDMDMTTWKAFSLALTLTIMTVVMALEFNVAMIPF